MDWEETNEIIITYRQSKIAYTEIPRNVLINYCNYLKNNCMQFDTQ